MKRFPLAAVFLLAACQPAPPSAGDAETDPRRSFDALETRLLAARTVRVDFHVTAEGAMEVDLTGSLQLGDNDTVTLDALGSFAGQPVDMALTVGAEGFALGNRPHLQPVESVPEHLQEALLIGLTRMGILHNLARLVSGAPPDHADGGVTDWVVVDQFGVEEGQSGTMNFELTVAGEPSGSASLEIGPDEYPVVRRQTVQFPVGEMRVVERYSAVTIEP